LKVPTLPHHAPTLLPFAPSLPQIASTLPLSRLDPMPDPLSGSALSVIV